MSYKNIWETKGLHRKFYGTLRGDEILEANVELHSEPKFQEITYIINDFIEVTDFDIDTTHTKIIAQTDDIISKTKGNLKLALLIAQDKPELIVIAQSYKDDLTNNYFQCEIFTSLNEAQDWVK